MLVWFDEHSSVCELARSRCPSRYMSDVARITKIQSTHIWHRLLHIILKTIICIIKSYICIMTNRCGNMSTIIISSNTRIHGIRNQLTCTTCLRIILIVCFGGLAFQSFLVVFRVWKSIHQLTARLRVHADERHQDSDINIAISLKAVVKIGWKNSAIYETE